MQVIESVYSKAHLFKHIEVHYIMLYHFPGCLGVYFTSLTLLQSCIEVAQSAVKPWV